MITLAVAAFAQIVAEQWRTLTGGEDGLTFSVPAILSRGFRLVPDRVMGVVINGRVITYYLTFAGNAGTVSGHAADRQFAVRPGAARHPGERIPRRGDGLPGRRLPHAGVHDFRRHGVARGLPDGAGAAVTTGPTRPYRSR